MSEAENSASADEPAASAPAPSEPTDASPPPPPAIDVVSAEDSPPAWSPVSSVPSRLPAAGWATRDGGAVDRGRMRRSKSEEDPSRSRARGKRVPHSPHGASEPSRGLRDGFAGGFANLPLGDAKSPEAAELLFRAAAKKDLRLAARLLRAGVHPGAYKSVHGTTALMRAAEAGDASIVSLLLEHHADPAAKNAFGETAMGLAAAKNHGAVVRLLPGGTHNWEGRNAKGVPCVKCAKVVGVGREGCWCVACGVCRSCGARYTQIICGAG